jgi:hypothetical protein
MQKYILSFIILILTSPAFSQGLSFSVVVDPQITWMNSDSKRIERSGTNIGIGGGLVMDKYFADNYAFSTGLLILSTGGDLFFNDTLCFHFGDSTYNLENESTLKFKLQYLTVPLSLKLKSNEIGYTRFYAHLGLNTHFNVKASGDEANNDISGEDIKKEVNWFMLSYFIGGGLEYSLGGNTALLGGIYFSSGIWDVTTNDDYRSHVGSVTLRLGVKF